MLPRSRPLSLPTGLALALLLLSAPMPAPAQEELIPHAQDRPPNPAKSPAEAVAAMTVPEGFTVEVVAAEPDLVNPVSMTFDAKGRIWVTESLEYPRREPGVGRDRVKVLEDTDGDGQVDKTTIFAEGLNIPSGIAVGHGGVWVANAPDLLFYPNADDDLTPDGPPQVIVSGFGRDDTHELPNSLTWGPDGRLYGWNGVFNPSHIEYRGKVYDFTCAIFRLNPQTRDFDLYCEGVSNPWGIAINDDGEFFASACVIDHLWHLVEGGYYIRQGGPYPPHTAPMRSIVDHKHQKAAYCGIHYFDSDAYPEKYRKRLYMGNIHGNCLNVDVLTRDGSTYKGESEPDFLSANDAWFMPVSQKTGPDGCLYVLDWYDRYHCYQDANRDPAGIDRLKGRLYRIRYQNTPRAQIDLTSEPSTKLIERLGAGNDFLRSTARRLLTERALRDGAAGDTPGDRFDPARLKATILDRQAERTRRLESLWVVAGVDTLRKQVGDPELLAALRVDPDPTFAAWAVRIAANAGAARADATAQKPVASDPVVLRQRVIAARGPEVFATYASALAQVPDDALIAHLVWQNLHPQLTSLDAFERWHSAVVDPKLGQSAKPLVALWPRVVNRLVAAPALDGAGLARVVGTVLKDLQPDDTLSQQVLDALTRDVREGRLADDRLTGFRNGLLPTLKAGLADAGDRNRSDFRELAGALAVPEAVAALRETLGDPKAEPGLRAEALDVLAALRDPATLPIVGMVLRDADAPLELRERALGALGPIEGPEVAEVILGVYDRLPPAQQGRAIDLLCQRPAWGLALVQAVESQRIPRKVVGVNALRRLLASKDRALVERVEALWGKVRPGRNEQRELVVGQMRNFLRQTPGDPFSGVAVFGKLCAQCHKIYGEGQEVGPEITLNGRNDFDQLVSNVFDPSLVIGQGYQATTVATQDGRVLTGLLVEDSPQRVVLRLQGGKEETVPRGEVDELTTSAVSLMPEGIEGQLTPQEIADLFAYLALDRPPGDPQAKLLPGAPSPARKPAK